MTSEVQALARRVDRVTVKGSIDPVDFYTIDCDLEHLKSKINMCEFDKENPDNLTRSEKKKSKYRKRLKRNRLKQEILKLTNAPGIIFKRFFIGDKELRTMRETFT